MPLKNTIILFVVPPKFCIKIVFNSSRGASPNGPREIESNAYAKFWRDKKQYYGIFFKGLFSLQQGTIDQKSDEDKSREITQKGLDDNQ